MDAARKADRTAFPRWRNWRHPLDLQVQYEGGSECYVMITCRGWRWRFPGDVRLVDVVACLNGQPPRIHQ